MKKKDTYRKVYIKASLICKGKYGVWETGEMTQGEKFAMYE